LTVICEKKETKKAEMGICGSTEQDENNKKINKQIQKDAEEEEKCVKILILGNPTPLSPNTHVKIFVS
jgi:hypothetical protein